MKITEEKALEAEIFDLQRRVNALSGQPDFSDRLEQVKQYLEDRKARLAWMGGAQDEVAVIEEAPNVAALLPRRTRRGAVAIAEPGDDE